MQISAIFTVTEASLFAAVAAAAAASRVMSFGEVQQNDNELFPSPYLLLLLADLFAASQPAIQS